MSPQLPFGLDTPRQSIQRTEFRRTPGLIVSHTVETFSIEGFHFLRRCWPGKLLLFVSLLCLAYHLANGIRHLIWDSGRALEIRSAYTGGWLVLIATALAAAVLLGVLI